MKKFRILTPIMVATAAVTPIVPLLTSCSKVDYSSITSEIKDTMISEFISLSKVPRMTWMCHEISQHIQDRMEEFGFAAPVWEDNWSENDLVQQEIKKAKEEYSWIPEDDRKHDYWGKYGNMWYDIPATAGFEDRPTIMLQAHLDMNMKWENEEAKQKWLQNGVDVFYSNDREICEVNDGGTPLGADNGIGLALLLSIAKHHEQFKHGKIRLMFTCEESGSAGSYDPTQQGGKYYVSGIRYLYDDQTNGSIPDDKKPLTGINYILSTDGNVKGEIFTSVAGLHECIVSKNDIVPDDEVPSGYNNFVLTVSGLSGGHSAYDINKGYGNALKMAMQIVTTSDPQFRIASISCDGGAYNICKECEIHFMTSENYEVVKKRVDSFREIFKSYYPIESKLNITFNNDQTPNLQYIKTKQSKQLCVLINLLKYGPITWFDDLTHQIVKTSCNTGPLNLQYNGNSFNLELHAVQRSASNNQLEVFRELIHSYTLNLLDAFNIEEKNISHIECPVWESSDTNKFAELVTEGFNTFRYNPKHTSSHAWIEMAAFPEMYNDLRLDAPQMACFGPTILHSHETNEELFTDTLDSVIKGTLYTLEFSDKLKNK